MCISGIGGWTPLSDTVCMSSNFQITKTYMCIYVVLLHKFLMLKIADCFWYCSRVHDRFGVVTSLTDRRLSVIFFFRLCLLYVAGSNVQPRRHSSRCSRVSSFTFPYPYFIIQSSICLRLRLFSMTVLSSESPLSVWPIHFPCLFLIMVYHGWLFLFQSFPTLL